MKVVGKRKDAEIPFNASAFLLASCAKWNDEMHKLPSGKSHCIPKGIYRYKTLDEADRHLSECLARRMANLAGGQAIG